VIIKIKRHIFKQKSTLIFRWNFLYATISI